MDTKALRQKILDLAIRGKLLPQDPNDEPASVLLERIRAEKQQMVKDGKLKPKDIKSDTIIFKGDDNLHYEKFSDGTVKCIEDEIPFELPDNWQWCRLQTICTKEIKRGKSPKYEERSNVIVFAQKCNTKSGFIDISKAKFLAQNTLKKYADEDFLYYNDIIINSTGTGTLGRVGLYKKEDDIYSIKIVPDSHITTVRTIPSEINAQYIYYFLKFNQLYFENSGVGSTNQKELKPEVISTFLIAIPPLNEQNAIIDKVNMVNKHLSNLDNEKEQLKELVSSMKSKILDLAIRGKIVPQDPNNEPSSVLIERIRAEKEKLIKQGKIKRYKKESVIFKGCDNSYYEKYGEKLPSGWVLTNFETLISYEQPTNYIVKNTNYNSEYETPVLTAGKSFILGYTDEKENIFSELPVIIFDDFTTESKFVNFPFKVKSSAMKILHINQNLVLPKYAFYLIQATEIDHDNHQRYWISTYSQEEVALPPLKEQERISSALEQYFKLLNCLL